MLPMWTDSGPADTETSPSSDTASNEGVNTKKRAKHRTKIGAHVEKKLRKNMRARITALFEEHLGKTRETKPLIEALTNLCLTEKQKAVDAQMRQIDVFYNFLAVIQKEIDFIKSGQRREVEKTKRMGREVDVMAANWRSAKRSKTQEINPSVNEADWIENHK